MRNYGLRVILGLATFAFAPAAFADKCTDLTTGGSNPFCATLNPVSAGVSSSFTVTFGPGRAFDFGGVTGNFSCPGRNFIKAYAENLAGNDSNQLYGRFGTSMATGFGQAITFNVLYKWTLVAGACPPSAKSGKVPTH